MTSREWEAKVQRARKNLEAFKRLRDDPEHRKRMSPKARMTVNKAIVMHKKVLEK